ncbi:MAG: hypothetical protein SVU32_05540, partial [Candidatus Nanohaloarchaea archaeon]|nr:hypothetical protein [Candidatus Nanohaloarchaea archaeon]
FRAGDSGFLTVTVQNMNLVPARELTVSVSNYYPFSVSTVQACKNIELSAATAAAGSGESQVCRWELTCGDACQTRLERLTKPSAVHPEVQLSYRSRLQKPKNSAKILFESSDDFEASSVTRKSMTISNGDLRVVLGYDDTVRADVPSVDMKLEASNVNTGTLSPEVDLSYSGSFMGLVSNNPCQSIYVPEKSGQQTRTCTFEIDSAAVTPGTVYNLWLEASYKYQKTEKVNLNIVPTGG